MKVYRKYDNKEIEVEEYIVQGQFTGYIEHTSKGDRFYFPQTVTVKEYYGM